MRKIVVLFNALNYQPGSLRFARDIAGLSGSSVTALFVQDDTNVAWQPELKMVAGQPYVEEIIASREEKKEISTTIDAALVSFREECAEHKLSCTEKVERGNPVDIITRWSRFADIMIVSPQLSFSGDKKVPTNFVADLLPRVECPVVLCSEEYVPVKEITLAYDGSHSAMYAIKLFFYLNPQYKSYHVKVLRIVEDETPFESPTDELFRDWMAVHCPSHSFLIMAGNAADILLRYFLDNEDNDKMLVTGAFGRGAVSRFFRRSTADLVVKAADIPVFVAHA